MARGLHQHSKALLVFHTFSAWGLCWSCARPCISSTSPHHRTGCRQMGSSASHPMGSTFLHHHPKREPGASPASGDCFLLMSGPAEHLEEPQLEAVTCQHLLGAHLALLPREIPASLYPVFLSFWLNFCCSPCAVPSCCPATAQGGSQSPLCTSSTAFPARWQPVPDRALLTSRVRRGGRCPSPGLPFPDGASLAP